MDEDKALRRTGLGMLVVFWVLALGLAAWWFEGLLERRHNPNAHLAQAVEGHAREVVLRRNAAGHFVAGGRINGEPVEFLLDTGATYLAVSAELAERLGLERHHSAWFHTANGRAEGFMTELDRVSLGGLSAEAVRGSINPGMSGETALLGMSFLSRFDIAIRGERLVLSLPAAP